MVGLDPDISVFIGGEKCRIENNVKIVCFIIFIVNNETSWNLFHSQQCHHQITKAQRFPCENSKRWGREDVNENTLLLHTKLFRALRNGSENTMNTRK